MVTGYAAPGRPHSGPECSSDIWMAGTVVEGGGVCVSPQKGVKMGTSAPRRVMCAVTMCARNPAQDSVANKDPLSGCLMKQGLHMIIPDQDVSSGCMVLAQPARVARKVLVRGILTTLLDCATRLGGLQGVLRECPKWDMDPLGKVIRYWDVGKAQESVFAPRMGRR